MFRFISHLLGKPFESCKGCEILKQQLIIANEEKKELTRTLIDIFQPKVAPQSPVELEPIIPKAITWGRRRSILEAKDREEARVIRNSTNLGRPDNAEKDRPAQSALTRLEEELGINDNESDEVEEGESDVAADSTN